VIAWGEEPAAGDTDGENLIAITEEIRPFTIEEGLQLRPVHSLKVINYGNQYARFISKMPMLLK